MFVVLSSHTNIKGRDRLAFASRAAGIPQSLVTDPCVHAVVELEQATFGHPLSLSRVPIVHTSNRWSCWAPCAPGERHARGVCRSKSAPSSGCFEGPSSVSLAANCCRRCATEPSSTRVLRPSPGRPSGRSHGCRSASTAVGRIVGSLWRSLRTRHMASSEISGQGSRMSCGSRSSSKIERHTRFMLGCSGLWWSLNGKRPDSSWNSITPAAHTSAAGPTSERNSSGAMNHAVPAVGIPSFCSGV
mmetsp:Transcript_3783/g.15287  ORF Transcript_3783/g.15287 Transcript_3783/m.15287 type:complete len:245 (-) Transcript_3783:966-1700(-)